MPNIVENKFTILGPASDVELLKAEIKKDGETCGGYHDYEVLLGSLRDLEKPGQVILREIHSLQLQT